MSNLSQAHLMLQGGAQDIAPLQNRGKTDASSRAGSL
jgi:hypothetical protein